MAVVVRLRLPKREKRIDLCVKRALFPGEPGGIGKKWPTGGPKTRERKKRWALRRVQVEWRKMAEEDARNRAKNAILKSHLDQYLKNFIMLRL